MQENTSTKLNSIENQAQPQPLGKASSLSRCKVIPTFDEKDFSPRVIAIMKAQPLSPFSNLVLSVHV